MTEKELRKKIREFGEELRIMEQNKDEWHSKAIWENERRNIDLIRQMYQRELKELRNERQRNTD